MIDWLNSLFESKATLRVILVSGLVGTFAGIAQGVIQLKHGGMAGFFRSICLGALIAVIVGLASHDYIDSELMRLAMVGVCAILADDVYESFKVLGAGLRADPLGYLQRLLAAIRGKDAPPPADGHGGGAQ